MGTICYTAVLLYHAVSVYTEERDQRVYYNKLSVRFEAQRSKRVGKRHPGLGRGREGVRGGWRSIKNAVSAY